jgi:hypothetical protein
MIKAGGHNIRMTKNLEFTERTQESQKQQLGRQDFTITNILKGYKVIDLTRPNELSTTMNKVATKSPERTRLWK